MPISLPLASSLILLSTRNSATMVRWRHTSRLYWSPNVSFKITITLDYERYIRLNELESAIKKEKILSYMADICWHSAITNSFDLTLERYKTSAENVWFSISQVFLNENRWGNRYILGWGGAVRPLIPWPCLRQKSLIFLPCFKTEFRFLIPCLRHLTRNHNLCETISNIETLSDLIHWQSQRYLKRYHV